MLVLSRKEKQTILVGDNIEITICRVSGRRVTIGLRTPSDVSIRRGEVGQEQASPSKDETWANSSSPEAGASCPVSLGHADASLPLP